jgi:hypothetical protein
MTPPNPASMAMRVFFFSFSVSAVATTATQHKASLWNLDFDCMHSIESHAVLAMQHCVARRVQWPVSLNNILVALPIAVTCTAPIERQTQRHFGQW